MDRKAIIEAVKEVGRLAFFAALTAVIGWVSTKISSFDPSSTYYIVGTVLLRLVDKYIHVSDTTERNGVSPF